MLKTKEEQIELVQQSFHEVLVEGESFIARFYATMFDMYPETREHFLQTDLTELRKKVLRSLVMIIDNLSHPDKLEEQLRDLGYTHTFVHDIKPMDYTKMGKALMKAMSVTIPETWTPTVETAWTSAYADVTNLMLND